MTPTPTSTARGREHERGEKSAERRARRRARVRKAAWRSALGIGVLAMLAGIALYWLLATLGGRDFLLGQVAMRLPADATFTWQDAEGPVSGPMTLRGVHFDYHGTVFDARRVTIDPDIRPLLGKLLRLDALVVEGATLTLPKSDKPFQLPRWPDVLPKIQLPFDVQADAVQVDGLEIFRAGARLIDIRTVRGGLDARSGKLHLEHLAMDSDRGYVLVDGHYDPGNDFDTDLTIGALLPAPAGRTRPRLGMVARGDLDDMEVAISGNAPGRTRLRLALHGRDSPRWTLRADSKALDPALLAGSGQPGTPLAFALSADGVGGQAKLHGRFTRGDLVAQLQPSTVRVEDQVLELEPLVVDVYGGRVIARGRGDFNVPTQARFKFSVQAKGLSFGGTPATANATATPADAAQAIGVDADFGIAGTTQAWAAIGKAVLTRDGDQATVDFDGRGDVDTLVLKKAHVAMPTGTLDAGGVVGWTPGLHWDVDATLAGFDPGYFAAGWPGAINGHLTTTGNTRDDGGLELKVDADQLGGKLRGRKLQGRGSIAMHGAASATGRSDYEGDVALAVGASRIDAKGTIGDTLDVDARLSPLQLADLLPSATGTLRGTLALSGRRNAPDIDVDLDGNGLGYGSYKAARFSAKGRLPWQGGNGTLAVRASDLQAGVALDTLRVDARGSMEHLALEAAARGDIGALDLGGTLARRGNGWQGTLATLHLAPSKGASWQLKSPARFAQAGTGWTLSASCFASSGGGSLCAKADWPRNGLTVQGNALPLALVEPYLPKRDNGRAWSLHGDITLDARVRPSGSAYAGEIKLRSASGGLRARKKARRDILAYDALAFDATFDARTIRATLASRFNGDGSIDARVQTGWDAYSPLSGEVAINTDQLGWLEFFSPDIVQPAGKLDGRITVGGTRDQPTLGGRAHLAAFTTELPSLGIVLQNGDLRLDARGDGTAGIAGSVDSGQGTLHVDGTLGWRGDNAPLQLRVRGDHVLVSDTRDLRAVASPDIQVRYAAGEPLRVTGKVTVPSALVDVERLDQGVSASDDVVVLDPVDPETTGVATPLALDLTLVMGKDVKLEGFGLDGTLGGQMHVNAVPGREMTASGALEVGGTYTAYGQELAVTRGHLQWSNTPVSDPRLDIRAEREIEAEDITAGIAVTGRASSPQVAVWTDPATSQSDALSYLALGRSTSSLSGKEGEQLNAASMALNAGGNLLASQLGGKIGLDNAGIMDSRALGGSVLGIGKKLSPRLYVGFGVSLLGTGQVLTLKYLISKGFDVEIESSTLENRGSINWRKER